MSLSTTVRVNAARGSFVTTHWSVVLTAGHSNTTEARDALAALCKVYWYPLYAYVRQRGHSPHDAQDLTQEFFAQLLAKNRLAEIRREGGKFRSFLLTAMNHFLVDEWRKLQTAKRGAGRIISVNALEAETRFGQEPADTLTPERLFDQNWALALLDTVYRKLEAEHEADGKGQLFSALKFCLTGERSELPYDRLAEQLLMPTNTVKTLVRRLRERYRVILHQEIAQSVARPEEVEEELQFLFRALAG